MEKEEFVSRLNKLIPAPSVETNDKLIELGDALWLEMKDDLYHALSFISRHFSQDVLQAVYDLSGTGERDLLPWDMIGAAICLQAGASAQQISKEEWKDFVLLPAPQPHRDSKRPRQISPFGPICRGLFSFSAKIGASPVSGE